MSSKTESKSWRSRRRSTSVARRPQPDLGSSVQQAAQYGDKTHAILHPAADISGKATEAPEDTQGSTADSYISLWDRACRSIQERDPRSKHLRRLRDNLGRISNHDTLPTDLLALVDKRQIEIRGKDGVSLGRGRKWTGRFRRLVLSTKEPVMRATRFDPSYISPIVLGGVYTLLQASQDEGEAFMTALNATMEVAGLVALWTCYEYKQMRRNQNSSLNKIYEELREQIIKMYMEVIGLLGTMMKFYDERSWLRVLRHVGSTISSDTKEWKAKQEQLRSRQKICESVKDRIKATKDDQELSAKILMAISKYDFRGAYQDVLEKTGVDKRYDDRCAWFIYDERFNNWATLGEDSILLLEGSKGTGKTTVMARAITEILESDEVQFHGKKFAMFFFQKTEGDSSFFTAKGCLQSLVRQLSWDRITASIERATEAKYEGLIKQSTGDTQWTTEECLELLKELIPSNETYIMIDGIDECKDSDKLLDKFSDLTLSLQKAAENRQPLHILLCGRQDLRMPDRFTKCISILTTPADSRDDQEYYVKTEIAHRQKIRPGSLFFKSSDYTSRLERLLLTQGNGLFRWIEMLIDVFEKRRFETTDDIEDLFKELLQPQDRKEMNDEYFRLLNTLGRTNRRRVIKLLKLLACQTPQVGKYSIIFLTLVDLAEAINASDSLKINARLTAEDVASILAGFVSVELGSASVRIAHASVNDFLSSDQSPGGDFSIEGLNAEAACLCLSAITYQRRSGFFKYSCENWPNHCRIATSYIQTPAAQNLKKPVKEFLFGDGWWVWYETFGQASGWSVKGDGNPQASIGFFVVHYDLIRLLDPGFDDECPYIRDMINLSDINEDDRSFFEEAVLNCEESMVQKLLQLFPDQVAAVDTDKCLMIACALNRLKLTETFLGMGASIFSWDIIKPAFFLSYSWGNLAGVEPEMKRESKKIQNLFVKIAEDLDARGFSGSLQRLLRMKDWSGETMIELCKGVPSQQMRLKILLDEATMRDGQVLYEIGDPDDSDIPSIREGKVHVQMAHLKTSLRFGFRVPESLALKEARKEYRQWMMKRHEELEEQYNEMKRAVEEKHRDALVKSDEEVNDN